MKKFIVASVLMAAVMAAAPSFAFIDAEVFGGYSFSGKFTTPEVNGTSKDVTVKGMGYGGRAHLTGGLIIIDYGIGGFFQYKPLSYSVSSKSYDLINTTYGFDGFVRLGLIPVLKPYVRAGLAIADKTKNKAGVTTTKTKYFNSYYTGLGCGIAAPIPGVSLMLFVEYLYNHQIYNGKLTGNTVNLGLSIGI